MRKILFMNTSSTKGKLSLIAAAFASVALVACTSATAPDPTSKADSVETTSWPTLQSPISYAEEDKAFVANLVARMSTEQKVGQLMQAEIQTITPAEARQYHIGSILNGGGSVPNRQAAATARDWAVFAQSFYDATATSENGEVAIPVLWGTDAVHGHGNLIGATIFPHNIGLGAANNVELMTRIGEVTAREVRASGIEWIFAPTVAVARNDRWGRTYESYSEHPDRVASLGAALVTGMQGKPGTSTFLDESHTLASVKHYLGDGGTTGGDDQGDTAVSEADLIRLHAPGYFSTLDAGALTVMASFSSWNGDKMHGNRYLLNDILRDKLDFNGFVVGDWNGHGQLPGCTNDSCYQTVNAGLDLVMVPYDWKTMYANTLAQVQAGDISESRLNEAVTRILLVKKQLGLFNGKGPLERELGGNNAVVGSEAHRDVARQAVRESLVLLKNNNRTLPIAGNANVLVAGDGANDLAKQSGGWTVTWQGTGTQQADYVGATSILQGFEQAMSAAGGNVTYSAQGEYVTKPDVAVVVFGEDPYAEGQGDINTLEFSPGKHETLTLLKQLQADGIPVVSVFLSGRPLWVTPYINASDAFVAAWLPGSEAQGIADVLVGDSEGKPVYDFSGTLAFSWPKTPLQDTLNVGDDNYDPLFAYGYGLTYAKGKTVAPLNEDVPGVAGEGVQDIALYAGRPLQPFNVFLNNSQRDQIFSGAFAQLPDGTVTVETTDKDIQEDALLVTFKQDWMSGLFIAGGQLDLSPFYPNGALEFDIRIDDMEKGRLDVILDCNINCRNMIAMRDWAVEKQGKGWQQVSIPMHCMLENAEHGKQVQRAFTLRTGGDGQFALANVHFRREASVPAELQIQCPANIATQPDTLNEYWAVDWWMPRHNEKVAQAQQGTAKLVMIGDSITHGWEGDGKAVWERYFGDIDTLNLGFGGDRTENVLWRLRHGELGNVKPDLVMLMIGTNNTGHRFDDPTRIRDGVAAILDELALQVPDAQVVIQAIFPRSAQPDDELRVNNNQANALLKALAKERQVTFVDFGQAFLTKDGVLTKEVMPDLLHPKEYGYDKWAKQIEPIIKQYVD